ncbi:MAG TPA: WcbI family polysaccharide biosynthesis putative acetyltransferase, partial [Rhizomicrobium sp.]|nr:WcbI family polysaccharide biosynthesis putative acetyltransferase [Rhizomicrobium sp.]
LSQAAELGYELSHDFEDWERSGVFMYTPNHPSLAVLITVAAAAGRKAGLPVERTAADGMQDKLGRLLRLPVYPAIAKRLRISSDPEFMVWRPKKGMRTFELKEYITKTYALYASAPQKFFKQRGIERAAAVLN